MLDYAKARTNMVDGQMRTNKVNDPAVIDAFLAVPREAFVPEPLRETAYIDEDLPLGEGRFLMEPMVLGRLVQAALVQRSDRALEVAGGPGYGAAILSRLAGEVYSVDSSPTLVAAGKDALRAAGIGNVKLLEGDVTQGLPKAAPYNVILFGGAVPSFPAAIVDQLAEGGRLVGVLREAPGKVGVAVVVEKIAGVLSRRVLFDAAVPDLGEFRAAPTFTF